MAIENPHNYSTTSGTTPTTQITDDVDYPHTGLIKSLSQGIRGNYAIKGSATDFDITFADGGSFTTIAVTTGKAYRDGKLVTITALSATPMNTSYNPGTGAVDITPVANNVYLILVAKSDNTMVLRGSNAVTNRIPDFVDGDIPIAIIKVIGGSADNSAATSDRLVQFLTTSKVTNEVSIGYDNSGYTESGKITGDNNSIDISSTITNADINLTPNGQGDVKLGTLKIDGDQTVGSGQDGYVLTYTHSNGKAALAAASGGSGLTYGVWELRSDKTNFDKDTANTHDADDSDSAYLRTGNLTGFSNGTFTATASTAGTYMVRVQYQFGTGSSNSLNEASGVKFTLQLLAYKNGSAESNVVGFGRVQINGFWSDSHFYSAYMVTLADGDELVNKHKMVGHSGSSGTHYNIKKGGSNNLPTTLVEMVKIA